MSQLMRALVLSAALAFAATLSGCATGPHRIDEPCTTDRAHYAGMAGWRYEDACSADDPELRDYYQRGRDRVRIERVLADAERDREAAEKRSSEDQSVLNHITRFMNVASTGSYTPSEDSEVAQSRKELAQRVDGVALSPGFTSPAQDTAMGFAAPVIALSVGFGAGQGLQGRWSDVGWKFTLADVSLLTGSVIAAHNCNENQACGASGAMLLGFFASRIWQTVDAYSDYSKRMKFRMAPMAVTKESVAPGATIAFEF